MRVVAVFDTNILLSAVLTPSGRPAQCIDLARRFEVDLVTCEQLIEEFRGKLLGKFRAPPAQVAAVIADFRQIASVVTVAGTLRGVVADPDDDLVLECAVVGHATHIVTGDKRHLLPLGSFQGIAIVSASDFLALAQEASADE